jgi:hypothetical protein
VLVARDRDALEAHLDTLLREEHPMAMRFEKAERDEYLDFEYWCDSEEGNHFMLQIFPEVPVSSDGRAWVACTWWDLLNPSFPALFVTTYKRPDVSDRTEVFEVFVLGTQMSKSALKT